MRRFLLLIPALLLVVILAVVVIALLIPKSVYRDQIKTAAESALGREVTLDGPIGLSFFPRITASVEDVAIANPEGFEPAAMAEAGQLRASVKWGPLLTRRVEVHELALVDANINLQRLTDGRANWEFATTETPPGDAETDGEAEETPPPASGEIDAGFDRARIVNTSLSYSDAVSGQSFTLTEFNAEGSVRALSEPLRLQADGLFDGDRFDLNLDLETPQNFLDGVPAQANLIFETDFADIRYDGAITSGETITADGAFEIDVPDLTALADNAGIDPSSLPVALGPLGTFSAKGSANGAVDALQLNFETLRTDGQSIDVSYSGGAVLGDVPAAQNGRLSIDIKDTAATLSSLGLDIAQAAALAGADFSLSTQVEGSADALSLSAIDFDLTGPLLRAAFDGDAALGGNGNVNGRVEASSQSLRPLLEALDIVLEPGTTLQSFRVSGRTAGAFDNIAIQDLDLALDDVSATGTLGFNLTGARPRLTGNLSTGALDLTPFMGPPPEDQPVGWSKTPLALESLNSVDADITLASPSIKIDRVTLTDTDLKATLTNGVFSADIAKLTTFGGTWAGTMGLDASRSTPRLSMALTGNSILMENLMQTLAGSDRLAGTGQFSMNISSAGNSVHDIMNALDGQLSANLADGALKGVNLGQLFRSTTNIRQALSGGASAFKSRPLGGRSDRFCVL